MKPLLKIVIFLIIVLSISIVIYLVLKENEVMKNEETQAVSDVIGIKNATNEVTLKGRKVVVIPLQPNCISLYDCMPVLNNNKMNHVTPSYCDSPHNEMVFCNESIATVTRISQEKCLEYMQYTFEEIQRESDNPASYDLVTDYIPKCTIDYRGFSIIGGSDTKRYEFPHMAAVGGIHPYENNYIWLCGGSIISELYVLSAAHCKIQANGTKLIEAKYVKIGAWNFSKKDEKGSKIIEIEDFILHPKYKKELVYHDIGLILLKEFILFSYRIRPICLPFEMSFTKKRYVTTGWGKEKTSKYEGVLQKVDLPVISDQICGMTFHSELSRLNEGLADHQICLGEGIQNDTCAGASGGPVHGVSDSIYCSYEIMAITSTGFKCDRGKPGLYTKIYNYIDWIEKIVWM